MRVLECWWLSAGSSASSTRSSQGCSSAGCTAPTTLPSMVQLACRGSARVRAARGDRPLVAHALGGLAYVHATCCF